MKLAFVALIALHGLIHLMGPAKAFGLAELPQLEASISRALGLVWLAAAIALVVTALLLAFSARGWWVAGVVGLLLSQGVIFSAWSDARFGTVANLMLLAAVAYGLMSEGPPSFAAEYAREVDARLADAGADAAASDRTGAQQVAEEARRAAGRLTEDDLARLPDPVQRYLRVTGAVGQPRVDHVRARWRGRIRSGPEDPWMEFVAEQFNFLHEPSRFFLMDARKSGLPVDVLHAFRGGAASMRVRLLSMLPLVDARGEEMTRAETVTLLNDMVLLAPSALADPRLAPTLRWEAIDARNARVHYTVGAHEVSAVLVFDDGGELVDFVSDDRLAASPDGREFMARRWSTPVGEYRDFGALRLMSRGEGLWHAPAGTYSYIELELLELETDPRR